VAAKDGVLALQKGLLPFVCYQFTATCARLGLYQMAASKGLNRNSDGSISSAKTLGLTILTGGIGGVFSSPFFLVRSSRNCYSLVLFLML